ncbi:hypothetical protein [Levilactobacillus andaensis]|uniref:hypothetical protein n=1 Tax=Levilactobacillus andaensis TaxID=2799570 RepID=UPI00194269C4|nr:hypothetical protein [Levilactobacillus andaensis]
MQKFIPWLLGILIVGGVLVYQQLRHLSGFVMLETIVLGVAAILAILHIVSFFHHK